MDDLWILRSVPTSSSEVDCVPVKKTILQKWLQTVLVFESVLSFADLEVTGVLCNYQPPLNHSERNVTVSQIIASEISYFDFSKRFTFS